jgi:aryl-alcohol dehydrogenase-like predicted oxidoreductase
VDYVKLGSTGLEVSPLSLGCMSFGDPARGGHQWVVREDEAREYIKRALDAGINFFDTANGYSGGSSEEILGRALADFARRDEVVVATKVYFGSRRPNGHGLSRKAIFTEIDNSLRRLGTDYVDLYQIHRWDDSTPIEETLEALHDVVKAGKARYIGASSMLAWQFTKALYVSRLNGWTQFVSMQHNHKCAMQRFGNHRAGSRWSRCRAAPVARAEVGTSPRRQFSTWRAAGGPVKTRSSVLAQCLVVRVRGLVSRGVG